MTEFLIFFFFLESEYSGADKCHMSKLDVSVTLLKIYFYTFGLYCVIGLSQEN